MGLEGLEPEEETEANVLIPMGKTPAVKVAVEFIGLIGPTFLPSRWRRAGTEDWRKDIMRTVDKWREKSEKTCVSRIIIDTESHITDVKMTE